MGYIVPTVTLEGIIKQLEANNKVLESFKGTPDSYATATANKVINANNKQIAIIKKAAPIDLDLYAVDTKKKK